MLPKIQRENEYNFGRKNQKSKICSKNHLLIEHPDMLVENRYYV